ncbi:MAG: hypothetical protein ACK5MN_05525 [Lachnospiraceae bacterium]
MTIGLADELVKLIIGRYGITVMVSSIVSSLLTIVLVILIFERFSDYFYGIMELIKRQIGVTSNAFWHWQYIPNWILAIIIIITLGEMGTAIYKTLRYSVKGE